MNSARRSRCTLDALNARTGPVYGTWSQIAHADLIDAIGAAGYDFAIIDAEHGALDPQRVEAMIRAAEAAQIAPLVRVPRHDTVALYKALDSGAAGVLVPGVESAQEAAQYVAAARFAPAGTRGACPIVRAADHSSMSWPSFAEQQAQCGVIAMIESPAGVAHCEAICATAGLKAVLVGPFDLSVALGHGGDILAAPVVTGIQTVIEAAQGARLPVWMPVFATDDAEFGRQLRHWMGHGVRHFVVGADKIMVTLAARRVLSVARAAVG